MTSILKAMWLVLLGAFAVLVIGVQSASALVEHSFTSDSATGSTVLTGTTEPGTKELFKLTGVKLECEDITYRGTVVGSKADHISVVPVFDIPCSTPMGAVAIDNNGCTYTLASDTAENPAHFPAGQEHANWSLACGHTGNIALTFPGCTVVLETVHSGGVMVNHNLPGVRYTPVAGHSGGKAALTIDSTVRTLKATTTGAPCVLMGLGNPGTHSNGTWEGKTIVTGYEDKEPTTVNPHANNLSEGNLVNLGLSTP